LKKQDFVLLFFYLRVPKNQLQWEEATKKQRKARSSKVHSANQDLPKQGRLLQLKQTDFTFNLISN